MTIAAAQTTDGAVFTLPPAPIASRTEKRCPRCGQTKAIDQFHIARSQPDGHAGWCKPCRCDYENARYAADPEPKKAREIARGAANPQIKRDREAARRAVDVEAFNERKRVLRLANVDRARERDRQWRIRNPDLAREWDRRRDQYRRARRLGQLGRRFTAKQLNAKIARFDGRCYVCGQPGLTLDHIVPLARGGLHELANLAPLCRPCNNSKSTRPLDQWVPRRLATLGLAEPFYRAAGLSLTSVD